MVRAIQDEFTGIGTAKERYYWRNKQTVIDRATEFRLSDPEKSKLYVAKHRQDNRDVINERHREWKSKNPKQTMIDNARQRAKNQNVPFDITVDDIVIPELCPILQIPLFHSKGQQTINSPSLDKIIPELGYVKGNIRVISYKANSFKSHYNRDQVQRLLDYIDGKI